LGLTWDEAPKIAGFFFRPSIIRWVEDLIAKGLFAIQSAEAARPQTGDTGSGC
jgi:hypothetical protein